jgi:hypothetical protein
MTADQQAPIEASQVPGTTGSAQSHGAEISASRFSGREDGGIYKLLSLVTPV